MGYSIKGTAATKGWRSIQKAEDGPMELLLKPPERDVFGLKVLRG